MHLTSLTGDGFRWLTIELWEHSHIHYFAANQTLLPAQIFRSRDGFQKRGSYKSPPAQNWILESPSACGWLTYRIAQNHFRLGEIILSDITWSEHRDSLAHIVSAFMIADELDVVHIITGTTKDSPSLQEWDWGEAGRVWSPALPHNRLRKGIIGYEIPLIKISPSAWWQSAHGQKNRAKLDYLLKKRIHLKHIEHSRCKRSSLLSRLFTWGTRPRR